MSKNQFDMRSYDDLPIYARDFLFYGKNIRNLSNRTIEAYYIDLRTFFRYLMVHKGLTDKTSLSEINPAEIPLSIIENLTLMEIYEYVNYVNEFRNNSTATRMRKISCLKSFYRHLVKQNVIKLNPTEFLETPKKKKSLPVYLSFTESISLLESIDGNYKERNFAIITLFLNCGMRLSELSGLNLSNITGNCLRILGKGNKERIVYLNQSCIDALVEYLKIRPSDTVGDAKNALFISRQNSRLSPRMIEVIVKKYIMLSGLDPEVYSPHKLRHTAATLMYQNGVDIRVLQEILGHANLGTTQIYTHLGSKQVEDALNSNPLNVKIKKK